MECPLKFPECVREGTRNISVTILFSQIAVAADRAGRGGRGTEKEQVIGEDKNTLSLFHFADSW